jgi:O-antigen/teichoic acid export membrane protein
VAYWLTISNQNEQNHNQKTMNRTLFIGILITIGLLVLASSLPNKFYGASDRKFIVITVITCIVSAIGLAVFFSIPFLTAKG